METLKFISYDNLTMLKSGVRFNVEKYNNDGPEWINTYLSTDNPFVPSKIAYENIIFKITDNPEKDDLDNAKMIFMSLKNLTPSQASDERIWVAITHGIGWEYMKRRWPLEKGAKDPIKYINKNYFFAHGETRSLMTNAISKLWWISYLTYDEDNENPFWLTEYIYNDINGRGFPLFGSNFSNNKFLLHTFLKTIKKFEEDNGLILNRIEFISMIKIMNLWGGKIILECLSEETLENKILKRLTTISKEREKIAQ